MNKESKRILISLFIVVILFLLWNSIRSSTYEVVTIRKVGENEMTIINQSNRERTIKTSIDITKLIDENKEYTIFYDKRIFDEYRLRSISQ